MNEQTDRSDDETAFEDEFIILENLEEEDAFVFGASSVHQSPNSNDLGNAELPNKIQESIIKINEIAAHLESTEKKKAEAKDAMDAAYNTKTGWLWFSSRSSIEKLQGATKLLYDYDAALMEGQKLLFEEETILAQFSNFLLAISCRNASEVRIAVQAIKMKLEGASKNEISEMAKHELERSFAYLKAQLDIMEKLEKMEKRIAALDSAMSKLESKENVQKIKCDLQNQFDTLDSAMSKLESKENVQKLIADLKNELSGTRSKPSFVPWLMGMSILMILLNLALVIYILLSRGQ